uniref:Uncharacterized protein n=1 Tax=Eutreptiella gymnastica TaxID=73025 RepID=A0A7S1J644_9EUGL
MTHQDDIFSITAANLQDHCKRRTKEEEQRKEGRHTARRPGWVAQFQMLEKIWVPDDSPATIVGCGSDTSEAEERYLFYRFKGMLSCAADEAVAAEEVITRQDRLIKAQSDELEALRQQIAVVAQVVNNVTETVVNEVGGVLEELGSPTPSVSQHMHRLQSVIQSALLSQQKLARLQPTPTQQSAAGAAGPQCTVQVPGAAPNARSLEQILTQSPTRRSPTGQSRTWSQESSPPMSPLRMAFTPLSAASPAPSPSRKEPGARVGREAARPQAGKRTLSQSAASSFIRPAAASSGVGRAKPKIRAASAGAAGVSKVPNAKSNVRATLESRLATLDARASSRRCMVNGGYLRSPSNNIQHPRPYRSDLAPCSRG